MTPVIRLSPNDNVAVACRNLMAGETINVGDAALLIQNNVNLGHKIAMSSLTPGDKIIKYGVIIGSATSGIGAGQWVHVHNMQSDYIPAHLRDAEGRDA